MAMKENLELETFSGNAKVKLSWADGMIGAIPIFTYKKDAKKYAGKKFSIHKIEVMKI